MLGRLKRAVLLALAVLWAGVSFAAVNINTASQSELEALPGIGPAKAKAIVEFRTQNGAFKSVDELTKVKGIGPAVLAKLKDQAVVGQKTEAPKAAKPAVKK